MSFSVHRSRFGDAEQAWGNSTTFDHHRGSWRQLQPNPGRRGQVASKICACRASSAKLRATSAKFGRAQLHNLCGDSDRIRANSTNSGARSAKFGRAPQLLGRIRPSSGPNHNSGAISLDFRRNRPAKSANIGAVPTNVNQFGPNLPKLGAGGVSGSNCRRGEFAPPGLG